MPRNSGATIPPEISPPDEYRRVLCIPASPEWLGLVAGALWVLTQGWYWNEATGDVQAVTERAFQMYLEYQDQNGGCDVATFPVGAIIQFGSASLPEGWLYCNGDELLKADYPALWDTITTAWGTATLGDDYFVLPDFRNKSPYGFQYGGGATKLFGSSHGAETVTLTEAQIPAHDHSTYPTNVGSGKLFLQGGVAFASNGTPDNTYTTFEAGGGGAHNNLHPVAVCGFIIFAGV